jgi:hypothetical protein
MKYLKKYNEDKRFSVEIKVKDIDELYKLKKYLNDADYKLNMFNDIHKYFINREALYVNIYQFNSMGWYEKYAWIYLDPISTDSIDFNMIKSGDDIDSFFVAKQLGLF